MTLLLVLPPGGTAVGGEVPVEELAVGLEVDAQLLVLDPGAIEGVAFSEGLALVLGY